ITAAFAHQLVDDDAAVRIRERTALAAAALFGGTGLIVDQNRNALNLAQTALHLVQIFTVMDRGTFRELEAASVFVRLVGYDGEMADAFRADLRRDLLHRQCAFGRLAPRHRDRVIVEDLVGHVDAGGDGKADRQRARMRIGAVTQVLEEVVARRKWRLPNPLRALATHGGETCRLPVHPDRHQVAADTRAGNGALRNTRRGVVRATGAEIGNTLCQILRVGEHSLELPQ